MVHTQYPMESFVARHVVMQLLFNGNMDNAGVDPETGEPVPERKFLNVIGRRELWTIILYVAALVPAFIFDDLGPVLSFTGSLGATSISYIAPGLAYLGLNGDDFLVWVGPAASRSSGDHLKSSDHGGEVELPVAGDATATMQTQTPPEQAAAGYMQGRKPWWWWPTAMPIWVAIASSGARGCNDFFATHAPGQQHSPPPEDQGVVLGPRGSDYVYSIVFIVFGVIAAVAGVLSNIYAQVNNLFVTP